MFVFSPAHLLKLLPVFTGRSLTPASVLRVGSQFASHHVTAALQSPEDSAVKPALKRQRRVPTSSTVQRKPVVSEWQHHDRAAHWKNETSAYQKSNQRKEDNRRMSSELRKLSHEDFPAESNGTGRQKSTLDPRTDTREIVFGVAPCLLALTRGRRKVHKLFVKDAEASQRASVLNVCEEAHRRGVQVHRVSKKDLDRMCLGRVHQGVCLQASPLRYLTKESAPNRKDNTTPLWLVLEGIQDPMNLGAILRSAYFLGVDRVVSSLHSSCPLSPTVSKASSGVMEVIDVYGCEDLAGMLKLKLDQGWQVVGTVGAEAEDAYVPITQCSDFHMTKPTLLLIGGEGEGLSPTLLSLCQTLLTIPAGRELCPGIESLNVSVATGVLLHSLLSSRRLTR